MERNINTGIETVSVSYFKPVSISEAPQSISTQTLLLPTPYATGDVATAAMIKGLVEFYFKPLHEMTQQSIELDPNVLKFSEETLKSFWEDVKKYSSLENPQIIL